MNKIRSKTQEITGLSSHDIPFDELLKGDRPVILRGLVKDWTLLEKAQVSPHDVIDYLKSFYNGLTVGLYIGEPGIQGRYFYKENITELNFVTKRVPLDEALEQMRQHLSDPSPPSLYVGSTSMDICLPGLSEQNDLNFNHPMFAEGPPLRSIWIGNPSIASAHYDAPNNIACVAVGRRRFTLFPPDQIENLYPGPLEPTPGGQVVSLVDMNNPDLARFPKFEHAMEAGEVAELEPGDAIFIPSMWWHHIESLSAFNVLINYWWSTVPKYMGTPMNVLYHALLSLKDRPHSEKLAWKAVFDYYVFGDSEIPIEHLPEAAQGFLGPLDEINARKLRAMLLNKLNR